MGTLSNSISNTERYSIRMAADERARAIEARTETISRHEALDLMLTVRGQSVMSRFLALALWAHGQLPRHRQTPSDLATASTIFFSLFPGLGPLELQQVFEQAELDGRIAAEEEAKRAG